MKFLHRNNQKCLTCNAIINEVCNEVHVHLNYKLTHKLKSLKIREQDISL